MVKYDRLHQVTAVLQRADIALGQFTRELANVGMAGVDGFAIDLGAKAFDIWFDNSLTDLKVRSKIANAETQAGQALASLTETLGALQRKGAGQDAALAALDEQRERMALGELGAATGG
jgi:hypothetical protein